MAFFQYCENSKVQRSIGLSGSVAILEETNELKQEWCLARTKQPSLHGRKREVVCFALPGCGFVEIGSEEYRHSGAYLYVEKLGGKLVLNHVYSRNESLNWNNFVPCQGFSAFGNTDEAISAGN
jgi:hypothetical protein